MDRPNIKTGGRGLQKKHRVKVKKHPVVGDKSIIRLCRENGGGGGGEN